MHKTFSGASSIVALSVAMLTGSQAMAQTSAAPASGGTPTAPPVEVAANAGDIVVTAQRRAEAIADVPLSIQAFSGAQLEKTGVRDLAQLIDSIPGASEGRGNAAGIKSYQIRGVSSFYGDSTVGYYVDEAAYVIPNRSYAPVARTFDVERVEVLRGPQGTLYGLGSMGGTIRFITADPDLEAFRVRGAASYSDTDGGRSNYSGDIAVSAPLIKDGLGIRVVASDEHRGGFAFSPSFPGDINKSRFQNYRAKLLAKPTPDLTLKLGYMKNITKDNWGQNFAVVDPPVFPSSRVPGRNRQEYDMYTGFVSFDAGPVSIESSTGYVDRHDRSVGPIQLGPTSSRLDVFSESTSFVQELRVVSQGDSLLRYVVGGIYQNAENLEDIAVTFGPPISSYSIYHSKSYAAFGEISYGFMDDRLRPLIGLRYFRDDRDFITQNRPPGPVLPPAFSTSAKFDSVNPRFNLAFQSDPNTLFYVNVARGFRSGTFNTASAVAASGGAVGFAVNPDNLWSYEAGTKLTLADGQLFIEAAYYHLDWKNVQLNYSVAGGVQIIRNAGTVKGDGFDYGINWRATPEFTLSLTGNINATKFDKLVNPAAFAGTPSIAVGKQLASVPRNHHNINATYSAPLGGDLRLYLNGSYTYISKQSDPGDTLGRFGASHDLARARAGLEWKQYGVYLFGDNILGDNKAIQVSGSGSTRYYPRTVGVELRVNY